MDKDMTMKRGIDDHDLLIRLLNIISETIEGPHIAGCSSIHGPGDETWIVEDDCDCCISEFKDALRSHE